LFRWRIWQFRPNYSYFLPFAPYSTLLYLTLSCSTLLLLLTLTLTTAPTDYSLLLLLLPTHTDYFFSRLPATSPISTNYPLLFHIPYSIFLTLYSLLFTLYSLLFTLYSLLFTLYSLLCTLYSSSLPYYLLHTLYSLPRIPTLLFIPYPTAPTPCSVFDFRISASRRITHLSHPNIPESSPGTGTVA